MTLAHFKNPREHCRRAKQLRKTSPIPERLLWNALCKLKKETGLKFRRQQPLHPYIVDFACMKARLAIEIDGVSHDVRQDYDAKRETDLRSMGWTVVRFTNEEVRNDLEGVIMAIVDRARILLRMP